MMARKIRIAAVTSASVLVAALVPAFAYADDAAIETVSAAVPESQAVASGADRASGKTLGAVVRQANPSNGSSAATVEAILENVVESAVSDGLRYTGYVLNQAVASGAGRASGKTLGAVVRQANPSNGTLSPALSAVVESILENNGYNLKN